MVIIWARSASEDLILILERVEKLFGSLVANKVYQRIMLHVDLLSSFPRIGVCDRRFSSDDREVRYLVDTPNIIYYVVEGATVYVVSVLDSRQSPSSISQKLSESLSLLNSAS